MYAGMLAFAQVIDHMPLHTFQRCVQRCDGHRKIQSFACLDQFVCLAFARRL
jgi:hypothetical protein